MNQQNVLKLIATIIVVGVAAFFSFQFLGDPAKSAPLGVDLSLPLGLDLKGGVHLSLEAQPKEDGTPVTDDDLEKARTVIEKRVNNLGVSEPSIQVDRARKRIIVELAGITDPERAVEILKTTAKLTFREVKENKGEGEIDDVVLMDGSSLRTATGSMDNSKGYVDHIVEFEFNTEGANQFGEITTKYLNKQIAIYLDDDFLQAPMVNEPILQGKGVITGYASQQEAKEMAALLRSGSLPVSMTIVEKNQVGAKLGADSMNKSLMACLLAMVLIVAFMLIYYRLPGLVASFALIVFAIIVLWVLRAFGVVLSMAGIAGFVLAVAMAVDLNIIVFERIKEEIAFGKSLRAAVDAGFSRAFLTVFDSNITTIFAAVALLLLGSSNIKGFAITLMIGIIVSLFTAVTFTRLIMRWVVGVNHKINTWWFVLRREV
jgi:protein-export SecD/SecF family membrane protein